MCLEVFFHVRNCKNFLSWKACFIPNDFAWSLLNYLYFRNKNKTDFHVFESCAIAINRYLFGTLPVATRSQREHKGFIIEINFGERSKFGLIYQKMRKLGVFDTFVVTFEQIHLTFFRNSLLSQWKF